MKTSLVTPASSAECEKLPLVAAQPGIWVADQLSPFCNTYLIAHQVQFTGNLNTALLAKAIQLATREADSLQMHFIDVQGKPFQQTHSAPLAIPECIDLRSHPDPLATAHQLIEKDLASDIRLSSSPSNKALMRHLILRTHDNRWTWYQRYHHIQLDAFSLGELSRRISQLYGALIKGSPLKASPFVSTRTLVDEYQAYRQSSHYTEDVAFWQEYSARLPEATTLSLKPLAGAVPSAQLMRDAINLLPESLEHLAASMEATPTALPNLMLALIAVWLMKLTNSNALSAGFIFMRRLGSVALKTSGPVSNVLPLAVHMKNSTTLVQLADQIEASLAEMRIHQRLDADDILRKSGRSWETSPLYGPIINFKALSDDVVFSNLSTTTTALATGPVRDLEIQLALSAEQGATITLVANSERYSKEELARHLGRLPLLLEQCTQQPLRDCAKSQLLLESERQLIDATNMTAIPLPEQDLVSCLIRQAGLTPNAIALQDETTQLNYAEMQAQVATLAAELIARGVRSGDIVAVALPRSVRLSIALQAIIGIGAAWLPLDCDYPDERLHYMLDDAQPALMITEASQAARFGPNATLFIYAECLPVTTSELPRKRTPSAQQIAYVIYTSGSTGNPKGVMVSHQAITNRLLWMQQAFPLSAHDCVLQKTPCSFDVSVWEFFWPLMTGARLVMAPPGAHRDPLRLAALIDEYDITTLHFVPSMLAAFLAALDSPQAVRRLNSLARVFASGEALPTRLARQWQQRTGVPLYNLYGPTEAAVDISWYPAFGEQLEAVQGASVPIGYPVWNSGLLVLDAHHRQQPVGVPGELYLTGIQLAEGYLGRPELTAKRFIANPFVDGQRMYQSGDVARRLSNGALEYLGRSDDQLKLRGQRIEPGEVSASAEQLAGVSHATTQAMVLNHAPEQQDMDARQLVTYVVSDAGQLLDLEHLKEQLAERLPAHMVPSILVQLDALPLTTNGKLDKGALPRPNVIARKVGRAPANGIEQTIAVAYGELLQVEEVSADDDFFALGGHSLLALELAAMLRQRLSQPVTIGHIMQAARVKTLAKLLGQQEEQSIEAGCAHLLWLRQSTGPRLFCFHPASGFAWQYSSLQRWIDPRWSIIGVQSAAPQGPLAQASTLDDIVEAHLQAIHQAQPQGPYYFLGYSLGGTLALAVAARLEQRGETVALIGLLDTWPPESQQWDSLKGPSKDDPVIQELERERAQFMASQQQWLGAEDAATSRLFSTIEHNYGNAVRLLGSARSVQVTARVELFVALDTLPAGIDLAGLWRPWLEHLQSTPVQCSHVSIISPSLLARIGPQLDQLLAHE